MPRIYYVSDQKEVEIDSRETILETSLQAGIPHAHACGGRARCSTCRVLILDGLNHCLPRNGPEQRLAERLNFNQHIRLACQTQIHGDVRLRRLVLDAEDIEITSQIKKGAIAGSVGDEKPIAILFADIRGFTSFSEKHLAYDVVHVLNRYFYDMGQVITRNGGYINNYMGDGIMALFGVKDATDATLRAVKAALEMLDAMSELNPYLENVYHTKFDIGIGIHCGEAVVGAIGAENDKRETAIGDAVNLASRIESANKQFETNLLISETAYNDVKDDVIVGQQVALTLKGKSGEHVLYEVTGFKQKPSLPPIDETMMVQTRPSPTAPRNVLHEGLIALGALLLGAAIVGLATQLMAENGMLLFAAIVLAFIGAPLMFWGFIR